jgi:hypothetical protein
MTDEPQPLFIRATYPMLMGILFGALSGMIGYGAWFFGSAAAVGISRWLT